MEQPGFDTSYLQQSGNNLRDFSGSSQTDKKLDGEPKLGIKKSHDKSYVGDLKDGKYHGKGILWEKTGKYVYEGGFKQGRFHGRGTLKIKRGNFAIGEFYYDIKTLRWYPADEPFYSDYFMSPPIRSFDSSFSFSSSSSSTTRDSEDWFFGDYFFVFEGTFKDGVAFSGRATLPNHSTLVGSVDEETNDWVTRDFTAHPGFPPLVKLLEEKKKRTKELRLFVSQFVQRAQYAASRGSSSVSDTEQTSRYRWLGHDSEFNMSHSYLRSIAAKKVQFLFDLKRPPVFRVELESEEDEEWKLMLVFYDKEVLSLTVKSETLTARAYLWRNLQSLIGVLDSRRVMRGVMTSSVGDTVSGRWVVVQGDGDESRVDVRPSELFTNEETIQNWESGIPLALLLWFATTTSLDDCIDSICNPLML